MIDRDRWAIRNDTRWNPLSRWAQALGLASPSVVRSRPGLVPLPTLPSLIRWKICQPHACRSSSSWMHWLRNCPSSGRPDPQRSRFATWLRPRPRHPGARGRLVCCAGPPHLGGAREAQFRILCRCRGCSGVDTRPGAYDSRHPERRQEAMTWRGSDPAACWAAREVAKVIPVEAETPPDSVFLATHTSIPIFQRDVVTNVKGARKTDRERTADGRARAAPDQPILPILGRRVRANPTWCGG